MPGVDLDCAGPGATHHMACQCREAQFRNVETMLKHASFHLVEMVSHFQDVKLDKHHRELVIRAKEFLIKELGYDDSDTERCEQAVH